MDPITIELDDKGQPTGALPEPLQKFFDAKFNEAFAKGAAKAAKDKPPADPVQAERLQQLEAEKAAADERIAAFELAEAERQKRYEDAQKLRDEKHAKEIEARDKEITRRNDSLRQAAGARIRAIAIQQGARDESLDELETLLGANLDLDAETLTHYVRGADGKPAADAEGNPVSIEGMVTEYLTSHPHHRKPPKGSGGGASGGHSLTGGTGPLAEAEAKEAEAKAAVEKGDRSPAAINRLYEAAAAVKRLRKG